MAKLVILYGHPTDPDAFEDYYFHRHLPFAGQHMPNVIGAETAQVIAHTDGAQAPYYRLAEMTYKSVQTLQASLSSEQGQEVLADLQNFATGGVTMLISEND
jgi:uncharacterized protein (TIGR02118 family)